MTQKKDLKNSFKDLILPKSVMLWFSLSVINAFFIALGWHLDEKWLAVSLISFVVQSVLIHRLFKSLQDQDKGYWGKVWLGVLVSAIAGVGLIATGFVTTSWIFPNYTTELRDVNEAILVDSNRSQERIDELIAVYDDPSIDIVLATAWFLKTVGAGLIISLVLGIFIKDEE